MKLFFRILPFLLCSCAGIQSRYHTVQTGDSLARIAKVYEVSVASIQDRNEVLAERKLTVGQKLYIPFEENPQWDREFYEAEREIAGEGKRSLAAMRVSYLWPVAGRVSSQFGGRYMHGRGRHFHEGIDIAARKGTMVKAARSGHVIYATNRIRGYGNMVIVQHGDQFSTVYAHLTGFKVRKGQFVVRGQSLGTVGRTGHTTGNHLHFEVRQRRRPVDPMPLLYQQVVRNP